MTLRNSPLAIDGALIDSATLRIAAYANAAGNEGIISKGDLKVTALDVPGNGVKVAHGAAIVLNRYQSSVDQAYVVSNVNVGILDSSQMPTAAGAQRHHLVVVTVGDPEFSQVGHPWMLATDPPAGQEQTFQYVRFHVIQNVTAAAATTKAGARNYVKNLGYPALALAGLTVPANTTTILDSHITDLRELANPRNSERIEHLGAPGANHSLNSETWENWPSSVFYDLDIPEWAVRAKITGFIEGAQLTKNGQAMLRVAFDDGGVTTATQINENGSTGRRGYNVGGEIAIPAEYRGTTRRIRVEGMVSNAASAGMLTTDAQTSGQIRVRLEEEAT